MQLFNKKLQSKCVCDIIEGDGDYMDKEEKKIYTLRIPKSLHFEIEKSANKESRTLNSWFLNVAKLYLEEKGSVKK